MKDEIKEILKDVKRHLDYVESIKLASTRDNEMKAMYDYITNLQEEKERLNNIINELEKWAKEELEQPNWASCGARCMLDKLKELKEGK